MRSGGHRWLRWLAPEPFDDPEVGRAHRVIEFRIVGGNTARLAVFPQCIQRVERCLAVCLAQVVAKALGLAPALSRPMGIVDVNVEFVVKEFREGPVREIEHEGAFHAEHPIDDRCVHGANLDT